MRALLILFLLLGGALRPTAVWAQEAPATSQPDTALIRERLEQAAARQQESQTERIGLIGKIERVAAESFTIETLTGTEIIPLASDTPIVSASQPTKKIAQDELVIDGWVLVIAEKSTARSSALLPLYIEFSATPLQPDPLSTSVGTIMSIEKNTLVVQDRTTDEEISVENTGKTQGFDLNLDPYSFGKLSTQLQALVLYATRSNNTNHLLGFQVLTTQDR